MEEVLLRFSHLAESIFEELDNQNLSKCLEVGHSWNSFIDYNNLLWIRIKKKYPLQNEAHIKPIDRYKTTINSENYCTTDLHLAALTGQTEIFQFLLQRDFLSKKKIIPYYNYYNLGMTPFHLAAEKGRLDICQVIVEKICNPSTEGKCLPYWNGRKIDENKMKELWKEVNQNSILAKHLRAQSAEAFDIACQNRQEKVARFLLENASILRLDLTSCFIDSYISGNILIAESIVNNACETVFDFNKALIIASLQEGDRSMEMAQRLIESMDIEKINKTTCLLACFHEYGSLEIAKLLIERLGIERTDVTTIFQMSCHEGLPKAEKFLMENSALISKINFNEQDKYGQSIFHLVCRNGRRDFAEFLIEKSKEFKIDLNLRDNQGMSGFHLACKNGKTLRNPSTWSIFGKPRNCIQSLIFPENFKALDIPGF
jgi:ankyrin repeat protein